MEQKIQSTPKQFHIEEECYENTRMLWEYLYLFEFFSQYHIYVNVIMLLSIFIELFIKTLSVISCEFYVFVVTLNLANVIAANSEELTFAHHGTGTTLLYM